VLNVTANYGGCVCTEGLCLDGGASSTYIVQCNHVCLVVSPLNDSGQSTGTELNF